MPEAKDEFREVKSRIKRAEKYVQGWHKNIEHWRSLYKMAHYATEPKPREVQYNDPTFTNTVDLSVGIMMANDLRWHAYGITVSKAEQIDTANIEKVLDGTLTVNAQREEKHLLYNLYLDFNRDGGGVIYSVIDPNVKPVIKETSDGTPVYFYKESPVHMSVVSPDKFICLPGGPKRWLMMGMKEKRSVLDVENAYGVKIERYVHYSEEEKSAAMGTFKNVWDYTLRGGDMVVRNTILFDEQNIKGPEIMDGYEDLPFTVQFYKPIGEKSEDWQNIMVPLESSVSMLERSVNRRAYQVDVFTGLPLVIKTQAGRRTQIDAGLYQSVTITPDEDIVFPQWPGTAPDVQMQIDFLRSRVQQSGFSDVMFGSGANQIAGYAISQLGDQNRIRLEQPIQHLELLLTTWAMKSLKLLGYFAKDSLIAVYGMQRGVDYKDEVSTSNFDGYAVRAEIRPSFPNEQSRKVAMATQTKGLLSNYTIRERYLDIQQPEDEEKRALLEATIHHPVAIQYAIIANLKEMADSGDEVAAMTLKSLTQMQGQAGRPKEPNKPEQFAGLPSPTGAPTPQEGGGLPPGQSALEQQEKMGNEAPSLME